MKRPSVPRIGDEPMLTAADVAEQTKSSLRSVRRWIAQGELETVQFNRSVRIEPRAFRDFLRRKRRK